MQLNRLERFLQANILPDLEKSRGGFDRVHTLEAVGWLKQIIKANPKLHLDKTALLVAAYAHDWGYSEIFKPGKRMTFDMVEKAKPLHMELGAKKIKKLLKNDFFSFLTDEQKERCVHLVAVHDKKYEIKDIDELILMEADMLSGLQISPGKPVYDARSNAKLMEAMLTTRIPKFITAFSKREAKRLIRVRGNYYKKIEKINMKSPSVIYRQLKPGDYQIGVKAAKIFYHDKISSERMKKFLADPHNYVVAATLDNQVIGFVLGYRLDCWHKDKKDMLLYDIEVLDAYRRSGIGSKLLQNLKSTIIKEGFRKLWLPTNKSNRTAMAFYTNMGGVQKNIDDALFTFTLKSKNNTESK